MNKNIKGFPTIPKVLAIIVNIMQKNEAKVNALELEYPFEAMKIINHKAPIIVGKNKLLVAVCKYSIQLKNPVTLSGVVYILYFSYFIFIFHIYQTLPFNTALIITNTIIEDNPATKPTNKIVAIFEGI